MAARVGLVRLIGSSGYGELPAQERGEVRAKTVTAASDPCDQVRQQGALTAPRVTLARR